MMNRSRIIMMALGSLAAAALMSGCVVRPYGGVDVYAPAPAVSVGVYPGYYVWDGYEYVGTVGGQYYYLGPGHVWIRCEPFRVARFHNWERYHSDWHSHAIRNDRYRQGNEQHQDRNYQHDQGRDHRRDQGRDHRGHDNEH